MKRALLLAFLVLAPLLPGAEAAGPEPRSWGSYNAGNDVVMLALAREGTTIVASVRAPPPSAPGGVPAVPTPPGQSSDVTQRVDTVVLDHEQGFARVFPVAKAAPDGRTHVAVSADGLAVASVRREVILNAGAEQTRLQLHYARIAPGGNWTAGPAFERTTLLGDPASLTILGLAMSDDGTRVAVLGQEGASYVMRGWTAGATALESAFDVRRPGVARALAGNGDLTRMAVAGQFAQGNLTQGGVLLFVFAQADAFASYYDASANNTDVRGVAISRDGRTVAAGGGAGKLFLFHDARERLATPLSVSLGTAGLGNITLSANGARAASAVGNQVALVDATNGTLLWNATASGQEITALSMDRTGSILVVGTSGTGGAVQAFSDVDGIPLWSIPGDTRAVAISADGQRVAYAQRAAIAGVRLPRMLAMDLAVGGKVAPTQTITVPGQTNITVTLRNDGAALERVVFDDTAAEIDVAANRSIVDVRPGAILRVDLTVSVTGSLVGQRTFNVTARSLTSGLVDNITMSVVPKPTLDVKLGVNVTDVLAQAGEPSEFLITIINNGTGDAPVVLNATQTVSGGQPWDVSLTDMQLTAVRGTRASVKVTVTPPAAAPNGTSNVLTIRLQGQDIFDTARVSFRINPELKVEVNATGVTKLIEPGRRASYNVTVTNTGSLPREFDVFYTITSSDNRNWGVDMPTQKIRLEPNGKRVFPVAIIAPADALPNERVSVRISAQSIPELQNETIVDGSVTLYGVAIERKVTTTTTPTNGVPFPTPLAAVAVLLLAALLSRRRAQ